MSENKETKSLQRDGIKINCQSHGKSTVRVGRRWVLEDGTNEFREWSVEILLESACGESYTSADNSRIVATDTQRNTCYYVAKKLETPCAPEVYGISLANHFISTYAHVSKITVNVAEKPWRRVKLEGKKHQHGFVVDGSHGEHHATIAYTRGEKCPIVTAILKGMTMLKTTQSGFKGFIQDKCTKLPDCTERMMASKIDVSWVYSTNPQGTYEKMYSAVVETLKGAFYGPVKTGAFSPSIQATLFDMGGAVLKAQEKIQSINLYMPNIHFLPIPPCVEFEDDVYIATSEPFGVIKAELVRSE